MATTVEFLRRAMLAGAAASILMGAKRKRGIRSAPNTSANGRPNVLFILIDDQPPEASTPHSPPAAGGPGLS